MTAETIIDEAIPSDLAIVPAFISSTMEKVAPLPLSEEGIFSLRLCLHEAVVNAIKHGNKSDKTRTVHVTIKTGKTKLTVEVTDEGSGFDPSAIPSPTRPKNIKKPGGRGIFLIKSQMDRVQFLNSGRTIKMLKLLKRRMKNECKV